MMMILDPVISVLMPVYNGERFLKEAIESILRQTFTNFEFIIINDGSTDSTEDIISGFTDNRIVYVKNEENIKLIKTLNKGIDLAKGKYIARMDADDVSHPNRFKIQLEQIIANNCKIVSSSYTSVNEYSKKSGWHLGLIADKTDLKFISMFFCPIAHPTALIETNLVKKYYYKDNKDCLHVEDFDLWSRMLKDDVKFFVSNKSLLLYRRTNLNITEVYKNESLIRHVRIAKQNQKEFIDEYLLDEIVYFFITPNLIDSKDNLKIIYSVILNAKNKFKNKFGMKFSTSIWLDYRFFSSLIRCKIPLSQKIIFLIFHPSKLVYSTIYVLKNSLSI